MNPLPPDITIKTSPQPGPALAVFAGVHGNELAGVLALEELIPRLEITRGTLYLAFANPPAIEQKQRLINKNLNRCFIKDNQGADYEDSRARELMAVLDRCDALLDLHAFNDPEGEPFVICEDNALDLASKLDPGIISTNWFAAEPGATDCYMYQAGKIGICVECGPAAKATRYKPLAIKTVYQFLKYFDMVETEVAYNADPKRIIRAERAVIREAADFYLDPDLRSFQKLDHGQIIGSQAGQEFIAQAGEYIIFPRPQAQIGAEAFVLGREVTCNTLGSTLY